MATRRLGLWTEIALALALITLATVLLNAGVFWLLLERSEEGRRTDLALSLSTALTAQLEVEARSDDPAAGYRRVLAVYKDAGLDVEELYVVDRTMRTVASVAGRGPRTPDAGFRAAFFDREQTARLVGMIFADRSVEVTSPIAPRGEPVAALRVRLPLRGPDVPGGLTGFVLAYTVLSGVAVALWGFGLFRRRLLKPVRTIQAGTERIARGDFGHLVLVDGARELEELCGALNTMSASLAAYRERTAEQVERLERANAELRQAQEALVRSERLAGVGRLAAGLAHEIGNPLAAVLGFVELLGQGLDDPAVERDLIDRSRRELDRIHRIIRQLLDYARPGTGEAEAVPPCEAISVAVDTARHQPAFREVALEVDCPDDLPPVRVERDKLHQVLVNLLLNAVDALDGAPERRIVLRAAEADDGRVEIRCEDTGPGFTAEALDRAFEPFFTTKDVGHGTGLGLATSQRVVEDAGGTIEIGNRPEGGAWVAVRLPRA